MQESKNVTNRKSTTPDRSENTSTRSDRARTPTLEDIEETETSLWVVQQLCRIHDFLVEHGADEEMLDVVDYLLEENKDWIDPEIVGNPQAGEA